MLGAFFKEVIPVYSITGTRKIKLPSFSCTTLIAYNMDIIARIVVKERVCGEKALSHTTVRFCGRSSHKFQYYEWSYENKMMINSERKAIYRRSLYACCSRAYQPTTYIERWQLAIDGMFPFILI